MSISHRLRRPTDFAAALKFSRTLSQREYWPREQLRGLQQTLLDALVRHAVVHSPFYRQRLRRISDASSWELQELPVLTKRAMMDHFDELVIDRRLRQAELLAHRETIDRDDCYLGRYRVMATSGSSGTKGLFVYDRPAWHVIVAQFMRFMKIVGIRPRLPRLRVVAIGGATPIHMTSRVAETMDIGLHRVLRLPVTTAPSLLVEQLNDFQPQVLTAYPSVAAALGDEQIAGRLRLSLEYLITTAELRTPDVTAHLRRAFGVAPFDLYGTTEGLWACECERHEGLHLFEDTTLVANVDTEGSSVEPGQPGARLLITSLHNFTQPIIRLELGDAVTLHPEPCACGRTLLRTRSIEGRSDASLQLVGTNGGNVTVHPFQFSMLTREPGVREFQVIKQSDGLQVLIVSASGDEGVEHRVLQQIRTRLGELGVGEYPVTIQRRSQLARNAGGKLQLVVDRTADIAASASP